MTIQPRKRNSQSGKTSTSNTPKSKIASQPKAMSGDLFNNDTTRSNATHVFFWGGILSNWSCSSKFSGARCFELLLPELEKLGVAHPSPNAFSSRLLADHMFNCGEQWMMAMKGWLFEQAVTSGDWIVDENEEGGFARLKAAMYEAKARPEWGATSKERAMWDGTVGRVLRAKNPRQQKALGRRALGFDGEVWEKVNMLCVTAACVARAEADEALKQMYLTCGERRFVEGSPTDAIWGVGIHWKAAEIEDPEKWSGENRLGVCHDRAAVKIRELFV